MERKNAWKTYDQDSYLKVFSFAEKYKKFISENKTERECTATAVEMAKEAGYRDLYGLVEQGISLKPGDRVYAVNMNKSIALFEIGTEPMEDGLNILGAHIDSPRLDLKQDPLYEDTDLAFLNTHYYGGIKKYQWTARPLALHGIVVLKDGQTVQMCIGEDESDPIVGISDLLIHLASKQMQKNGNELVAGEDLNVLVGSIPAADDGEKKEKRLVADNILSILNKKYGIKEEDFLSAEIEVVPAGPARDYGIDKSMIAGYGQDDRVCAYPSLVAQLQVRNPRRTSCTLLVDKEEIGSVGATGMHSHFFENTLAEVMNAAGQYSELALRRALRHSRMLSSDVSAAYDPNYPDVMEKQNTCYFGKGVVFNKYTGARGKSGSNDANAEFLAMLRRIMDDNNVAYQTAELGKVDAGGGGTIAYIMADYDMSVVDSGVAVQNMHAPMEVTSKADLYEALKCYCAFLSEA
ncbi:MAG: aminopeptidase [Lachnospiraceae bacterium]|jgi:aspartyl aminopeptidase